MDDSRLQQLDLFNESSAQLNNFEKALLKYMGAEWFPLLRKETNSEWFYQLALTVAAERKRSIVHPPQGAVFEALKRTPFSKVKVVIIGQDPYHDGRATGLAFANKPDGKINPSLRFILDASGCTDPTLSAWADQGVLLLNRVLTVRHRASRSHQAIGWEKFTDAVIDILNAHPLRIGYLLWGRDAGTLGKKIDSKKHMLIKTEHPAAAAYAGREWHFQDCFNVVNEFLERHDREPVVWG